jgi:hypothetical protein
METGGGNSRTPSLVSAAAMARVVAFLSLLAVGCRSDGAPAETGATAPSAVSADACGRPPLPSCPLQQWMDANLAPALREGRMGRLVAPLQTLAAMAPAEFTNWKATALAGAAAAAQGDRDGVRGSCGSCHDAYRAQYRAAMRARPIVAANAATRSL